MVSYRVVKGRYILIRVSPDDKNAAQETYRIYPNTITKEKPGINLKEGPGQSFIIHRKIIDDDLRYYMDLNFVKKIRDAYASQDPDKLDKIIDIIVDYLLEVE